MVLECISVATQAPSGGDRQHWRFVVVDEPDLRAEIAAHYRRAHRERREEAAAGSTPGGGGNPRLERSVDDLAERLASVPVLVIPCVLAPPSPTTLAAQASLWGSILPATWSFMLAARLHGLGTTFTTLHLRYADEVAALLGIPAGATQAGLVPVAYARGTRFRPARRRPVEQVVHWNGWAGAAASPHPSPRRRSSDTIC